MTGCENSFADIRKKIFITSYLQSRSQLYSRFLNENYLEYEPDRNKKGT